MLGTNAMIQTDNNYPNTAKIFSSEFCGNADMPFDFFMSRYKEAYVQETLAFVDSLVNDKPSPCSGEDGLIALVRRILAMHLPSHARYAHACVLWVMAVIS